jgi:hypothetical protein
MMGAVGTHFLLRLRIGILYYALGAFGLLAFGYCSSYALSPVDISSDSIPQGVQFVSHKNSPQDQIDLLQRQIEDLEQKKSAAEDIPGSRGVSMVLAYDQEIDLLKQSLLSLNPSLESAASDPFPSRPNTTSIRMFGGSAEDVAQDKAVRLQNLEQTLHQLHLDLNHPNANKRAIQKKMKSLLEEYKTLEKEIETSPITVEPEQKSPQEQDTLRRDQLNADPHYVTQLQESLQNVYDRIFLAREKSLKAASGVEVQKLGLEISDLEREEVVLKNRLQAIGQTPMPPRVLQDPSRLDEAKIKDSPEKYEQQLLKEIQTITHKITELKQAIGEAQSGNHLAQIGAKLNYLESQRMLLEASLPSRMQAVTSPSKPYPPMVKGPQNLVPPEVTLENQKQEFGSTEYSYQSPRREILPSALKRKKGLWKPMPQAMTPALPSSPATASTPVASPEEQNQKAISLIRLWENKDMRMPSEATNAVGSALWRNTPSS